MKDTRIEQFLDSLGLTYKHDSGYVLANIDRAASHDNQARTTTLFTDVVNKYHKKMREGVEFPAIIVTEDGVTLDGNHRVEAALLDKRQTYPAYILIDPTEQQIALVIASANDGNGEGATDEDRLEHALHLVYVYGYAYKDAGAIVGLSSQKVTDGFHKREGARISTRAGIQSAWAKLSDSSQVALARAGLLDEVFIAAAKVSGEKGWSTKTVQALLVDVKKARNLGEQLDAVEKFSKKNKAFAHYGGLSTPAGKLMAVLAQCTIDSDAHKAFLTAAPRLSPERRKEIAKATDSAIAGLRKLRSEL